MNFICVLLFFMTLEYFMYIYDYNNLKILDEYIQYEVEVEKIGSFSNEKYMVEIEYVGNEVYYTITMQRRSFFNFEKFKTIKYDGIVC